MIPTDCRKMDCTKRTRESLDQLSAYNWAVWQDVAGTRLSCIGRPAAAKCFVMSTFRVALPPRWGGVPRGVGTPMEGVKDRVYGRETVRFDGKVF